MPGTLIILLFIFLPISGCFESPKKNTARLSSFSKSEFSYRGVIERSVELKFILQKSEISNVLAIIDVPSNYNGPLKYKWALAQGVQIQSGELTGEIQPPKNKKIKLQISVTGMNEQTPRYIRFEIIGLDPKRRVFADGIISSQQQNSFEEIVKEIEDYKKRGHHEN